MLGSKHVSEPSSGTSSSDQLPSLFANGFHMNPNLSQMDPGKMKRCLHPLSGRRSVTVEKILEGMERGNGIREK